MRDMSKEKTNNSFGEKKILLKKDLREGLQGIKELLVAAVALGINIATSLREKPKSTSITSYQRSNEARPQRKPVSFFEETTQSTNPQAVDIDIEIEGQNTKNIFPKLIKSILYPFLAAISTTALVTGVVQLRPLIEWARTQNECIQSTKGIDGKTPLPLSTKVMTCNGGHSQ